MRRLKQLKTLKKTKQGVNKATVCLLMKVKAKRSKEKPDARFALNPSGSGRDGQSRALEQMKASESNWE